MTFTIDSSEFDAAAAALAESLPRTAATVVQAALRAMGNAVRRNVKKASKPHKRTGHMYRHVQLKATGRGINSSVKVYAGGSAAVLVIKGTKPHRISARPDHALNLAKATAGVKLGEVSGFADHVENMGVTPDPFFYRGMRMSQQEIDVILSHSAQTMADVLADDVKRTA